MPSAIFAAKIGPGLTDKAATVGWIGGVAGVRIAIVAVGASRGRSNRRSPVNGPSGLPTRNSCHANGCQRTTDPRLRALNRQRDAALLRPTERQQCRTCEGRRRNRNLFQTHLHGFSPVPFAPSVSQCARAEAALCDRSTVSRSSRPVPFTIRAIAACDDLGNRLTRRWSADLAALRQHLIGDAKLCEQLCREISAAAAVRIGDRPGGKQRG
jgi:hypothetical protein